MKRLIVGLVLLAAPATMRAQTCTASPCTAANVITSLKIKSSVAFSAGSNLDFGSVAGGTTASVDAQGTTTSTGTAGAVILNANQAVTVTASFAQLTAAGFPNLTVSNPSCGYSSAATTSTTNTTLFICSTGYASPATGTTALRVWLGGEVVTAASTPAGNYAGTATVTGTYTAY